MLVVSSSPGKSFRKSLQKLTPTFLVYKSSPYDEENSVCAAYHLCGLVYMCDSMEVRGVVHAIFEIISAIAF